MALESATYINGLVTTNPLNTDNAHQADDHLRLLKSVLKNSFPNITGAVTLTQAQINALPGDIDADVLALFNAIKAHLVPTGVVQMWSGSVGTIPTGWALCDGSGGTPDLRSRFIIGAGGAYAVGATGGTLSALTTSSEGAHTHSGNTGSTAAELPKHTHKLLGDDDYDDHSWGIDPTRAGVAGTTQILANAETSYVLAGVEALPFVEHAGSTDNPTHTHTISSDGAHTHTVTATPPYYALCYIMKTSTTPTSYP